MSRLIPWAAAAALSMLSLMLLKQNRELRRELAGLSAAQQAATADTERREKSPYRGSRTATLRDDGAAGKSERMQRTPPARGLQAEKDTGNPPPSTKDPAVADRIEERAQELADQLVEERRSERMERIQDRIDEKVSAYAEEAGWTEETASQVIGLALERFEDHWMLRSEVEAGDLTREEAQEEHMRRQAERETRLEELLGEEEAETFLEEMRPPHHGRWR